LKVWRSLCLRLFFSAVCLRVSVCVCVCIPLLGHFSYPRRDWPLPSIHAACGTSLYLCDFFISVNSQCVRVCVITCRMLFSLSCLLWSLSPLKRLFSNFPSFCILTIPPSSAFLSLQSLISCLQRNQAQKQHLCVCVCVCSVAHSGVVRKGVSPRSTTHPSVFSNSFFLSYIYSLLLLPSLSLSLSLSPLSGLQFYNLLKICVSSPAPCFLLHI